MKSHTRIILPDVHMPFHDPALLDCWLAFVRDARPQGIDILGDLIDCYHLSRFDKNPARKFSIQDEVDAAVEFLGKLRAAAPTNCDIRYSEGNHENRLTRVLWTQSKVLEPIRNLSIPALLGLSKLGIQYVKPETPYQIGRLWFLHGDLARKCNWAMSFGGTAAAACVKRVGGSVLMGHSHQMGHVSFRTWGHLLEGFECGCLCQFDMEYVVGVPQWQQGWAVVDFTPSGCYDVSFVRLVERDAKLARVGLFRGKELFVLPPAKMHRNKGRKRHG